MASYKAPWSTSLVVMSAATSILLFAVAVALVWGGTTIASWFAVLPLVVVLLGILFLIRGYTVTSEFVFVHRLLWSTRISLADLSSVQFEPDAMRASTRVFGNGGLFSFTGIFRSKRLGRYRAFATDLHRTVVLAFPSRTIVVTPAMPEEFTYDVSGKRPSA